jgi:hypothetical protein
VSDLVARQSYRAVTPTVFDHAHHLDGLDPAWGLFPGSGRDAYAEPDRTPPPPPVLLVMQRELEAAQAPCSMAEAVTAAATLIAAYPQADNTTGPYAKLLAVELARVPRDQLGRVFDKTLDASPDFRPGIGRVRQVIEGELAKRRILAKRVEAGLRYWQHQAEQRERDEPRLALTQPTLPDLKARYGFGKSAEPAPVEAAVTRLRAAPVSPDYLEQLRQRARR